MICAGDKRRKGLIIVCGREKNRETMVHAKEKTKINPFRKSIAYT